MLYLSQIFYEISTYFTGTINWAPKLHLLLKSFQLSAFFDSACIQLPKIAPILLTVSKPNLLALLFRLFTVTAHLRLWNYFHLN